VLIVGSGQSGCQIADELLAAGRTVYLAVGGCPWFPRRYRGKDILHWVSVLGILDETVDSLPAPRARMVCNPPVSGNDGGHDCHPGWLAVERGAQLVGRVARIEGSIVSFAPGLGESLASGNAFVQELTGAIDAFVSSEGLDAPASDLYLPAPRVEERAELDLEGAGITSILWASGFRPDYSWVDVPLADGDGWAVQERGITRHPGLYVVGLNWLHKRKSALFMGVGEDAEHVARHLAARA
jgi:putative flavoprotein involved in K+ transport